MSQQKFWCMQDTGVQSKLAEWVNAEIIMTEKVICPINSGHQRAGKRIMNLSVALSRSNSDDFVWTWYNECLLTDRVLELFKTEGFTGFEVKPVKIKYTKSKQIPSRLWELVVMGRAGIASPESGVKLIESCSSCGLIRYSTCLYPDKLIDESQWDGSDVFMVSPVGYIFITSRLAALIHRESLSGVVLKPPGDLDFGGHTL